MRVTNRTSKPYKGNRKLSTQETKSFKDIDGYVTTGSCIVIYCSWFDKIKKEAGLMTELLKDGLVHTRWHNRKKPFTSNSITYYCNKMAKEFNGTTVVTTDSQPL